MHRRSESYVLYGVVGVLVSVVAIGLAYAGFTQTLNINGTARVVQSKWDIYFANLSSATLTGQANEIETPTIKTKTSIGNYLVELNNPGDSITYTFDIVNDGNFDASLTSLTKNAPTCSGLNVSQASTLCNYLTYTLTYTNNNQEVAENDMLLKKQTRNVTLKLMLNLNTPASALSGNDVTIGGLGITLLYSQSSGYNGINSTAQDLYNGATFVSGSNFNKKIKRLAGNTDATSDTIDTNIISIQRSNTLDITPTDDNIVSTSDSSVPIYAWYNNGTIYYYTEYEKPYLNATSSYMFNQLKNVTSIDLNNINASRVTTFAGIFQNAGYSASSFTISGLSSWKTSSVTNMNSMFSGAGYNATTWSIGDLSNWNTSNVIYMNSMFSNAGYNANSFSLDLSSWNTSKVQNMSSMFSGAGRDAGSFSLDLSNWNTSSVQNMATMFQQAGKNAQTWSVGNLSNWNTSSVTTMQGMFSSAGQLATTWSIGDLSNWNTSNVTNMSSMFNFAGQLATTWNSIGTLNIFASNINYIFNSCSKAKATLNIHSNPTSYSSAFNNAATISGSGMTVNYSTATTNIDNIINTKSNKSIISKGSLFYDIIYNSNGGSSCMSTAVMSGDSVTTLCIPTKEEYTFGGWFTDDGTFNNQITTGYTPSADTQVYAKWNNN